MAAGDPTVSTHVLDTALGAPAAGVRVTLFRRHGTEERVVGEGITDMDGRIRRLLAGELLAGDYRLEFELRELGAPAKDRGGTFFTRLAVDLHVSDPSRSYHVPLL